MQTLFFQRILLYWSDADTSLFESTLKTWPNNPPTKNRGVFYGTVSKSQNIALFNKINTQIRVCGLDLSNDFSASQVFMTTWLNLPAHGHTTRYPGPPKQGFNTFQLVLVTDGDRTFAIYNYDQLSYAMDDSRQGYEDCCKTPTENLAEVTMGLDAGDGQNSFSWATSRSQGVTNLVQESNCAQYGGQVQPGRFIYRIDKADMFSGECSTYPCKNLGMCQNIINGFACTCVDPWTGDTCEEKVSPCTTAPCVSTGTEKCVEDPLNPVNFLCKCNPGYTGTACESWIDLCEQDPCHQHSTGCTSMLGVDFYCNCPTGYTGKTCSQEINECGSYPCMAPDATCVDSISAFTCICPIGYAGVVCEVVPCNSDPCQNGGQCEPLPNGAFQCFCKFGFTGKHCGTNINECRSSPCDSSATCHDLQGSFACECAANTHGTYCEIEIKACDSTPCWNGASCIEQSTPDELDYSCYCYQGFTGPTCALDIDECSSSPCLNGAVCQNIKGFGWQCKCALGFEGGKCENEVDECFSDPCQNNGNCVDLAGRFECECVDGFQGFLCQHDLNECQSLPCKNGGTCEHETGVAGKNFICLCPNGFLSTFCEQEVNECSSSPCASYATCKDLRWGWNSLEFLFREVC